MLLKNTILSLFFFLSTSVGFAQHEYFIKIKDSDSLNLAYPSKRGENYLNGWIKENEVTSISKAFKIDDPKLQRIYLIKSDREIDIEKFNYKKYSKIEYIEEVPKNELFYTPNDLQGNQWNLQKIQAELAWDISTGNNHVKIAMVDDAVRLNHEDLSPVIWTNPNESVNGIDDDGNGYVDDINGWDAANDDNDPNPYNPTNSSFTHGTHCAGIAASATDNNTGIASISHNVSLIPVKIADDFSQSLTGAYAGVEYAIIIGADIISMS